MLVYSRQRKQSVVVDCSDGFALQLKITVLAVRGEKVTLGFDVEEELPAPRLKRNEPRHIRAAEQTA